MATVAPLELEPSFDPRLWGRRDLSPLYAERTNLPEPIGEAWLTGPDSRIVNGPLAGQRLGASWTKFGREVLGTRTPPEGDFPLLAKFLFPEEKLSIQVHPNDAYARARAAGRGKTEMWYVVNAPPGATLRLGLRSEVTRAEFERALAEGTLEACLEEVPLAAGDVLYCPAGTVHTIMPGATLCEIQEPSDITYRLFDYNRLTAEGRLRPLHVEQALEVIRFGRQACGKIRPWSFPHAGATAWLLLACPYFATEKYESERRLEFSTEPERFEIVIVVSGVGRLVWSDGERGYRPGATFLIPAALGVYALEPAELTTMLLTYVPDLEKDFSLAPGAPVPRDWAGVVFPEVP